MFQERNNLDDIFTVREGVATNGKAILNLVIPLFDFEKAYDRVDWSFLWMPIEAMQVYLND
jgi:hypothetical protein